MPSLYTIGHSNRSINEFIQILKVYNIKHIVDVRSLPKSLHVPHFNKEDLKKTLRREHILYTHVTKLGGLRHTNKDSMNTGWRNKSFRGYADYMQTQEFFEGLKTLNHIIKTNKNVAIMCAEAVPWRCHRSLIADAEIIRHYSVWEILSKTSVRPHRLTDFAVVNRKKRPMQIYYPSYEC